MGKESFFHAREHYQRELQTLRGMQRHEGNLRTFVVLIGVADEGGMIEETGREFRHDPVSPWQRLDEFAQVLDARVRLGSISSSSCLI